MFSGDAWLVYPDHKTDDSLGPDGVEKRWIGGVSIAVDHNHGGRGSAVGSSTSFNTIFPFPQ